MKTKPALFAALAITSTLMSGTASAFPFLTNPWKHLPVPYYSVGTQKFDKAHYDYQNDVVLPRCTQVANETTMSAGKAFWSLGWNGALTNAVGDGANTWTQFAVAGAKFTPLTGEIITAGAFAGGFIISGGNAVNTAHSQNWGVKASCTAQDAAGLHMVPPSIAKKIANGTLPEQSFASPFEEQAAAQAAAAAQTTQAPGTQAPAATPPAAATAATTATNP